MNKVLTLIMILCAYQSNAQYKYIQLNSTFIRYSSSVTPTEGAINGKQYRMFLNANSDTLAVVYENGLMDVRTVTAVKDTLTSLSIIEPSATLSSVRYLFNGRYAIIYNANKYRVVVDESNFYFKIFRKSDNALYCKLSSGAIWWNLSMPVPVTLTSNIKSITLP